MSFCYYIKPESLSNPIIHNAVNGDKYSTSLVWDYQVTFNIQFPSSFSSPAFMQYEYIRQPQITSIHAYWYHQHQCITSIYESQNHQHHWILESPASFASPTSQNLQNHQHLFLILSQSTASILFLILRDMVSSLLKLIFIVIAMNCFSYI